MSCFITTNEVKLNEFPNIHNIGYFWDQQHRSRFIGERSMNFAAACCVLRTWSSHISSLRLRLFRTVFRTKFHTKHKLTCQKGHRQLCGIQVAHIFAQVIVQHPGNEFTKHYCCCGSAGVEALSVSTALHRFSLVSLIVKRIVSFLQHSNITITVPIKTHSTESQRTQPPTTTNTQRRWRRRRYYTWICWCALDVLVNLEATQLFWYLLAKSCHNQIL